MVFSCHRYSQFFWWIWDMSWFPDNLTRMCHCNTYINTFLFKLEWLPLRFPFILVVIIFCLVLLSFDCYDWRPTAYLLLFAVAFRFSWLCSFGACLCFNILFEGCLLSNNGSLWVYRPGFYLSVWIKMLLLASMKGSVKFNVCALACF